MERNKIPIVLIHRGDSPYLAVTILQLIQTNPGATIYLIGDKTTKYYKSLIHHVMIDTYSSRANAFKNIYRHFSTNGYEFELMCLQRWFVLLEFMEAYSLRKCIYIDSDVLVYSNLNELQPGLNQYGMTFSGISAHTNFVNSRDALGEFCNLIGNAYSSERSEEQLLNRYEKFRKDYPLGGISDMTFLMDFVKANPDVMCDLSQVREGSVFDITLDNFRDYLKDEDTGFKKISWRRNVPYATLLTTGENVKFHTLHFQGQCKKVINSYSTLSLANKSLTIFWLTRHYYDRTISRFFG